jgi:26S proteasome regulatory subunit N5
MSEGTLKPEKDFSKEVDKLLPDAEKLAKVR